MPDSPRQPSQQSLGNRLVSLLSNFLYALPPASQRSGCSSAVCASIPTMASPKLGLSATTTTSSSPLSSSALPCPPLHPGSPSQVPDGPPSPVTPTPSPGLTSASAAPVRTQLSIALILEELRVLQQRQIHQMQITEEICRQVLRLGGDSYSIDTPSQYLLPPLPQLCLEGSKNTSQPAATQPSTTVTPLLACFSSMLPSQTSNKPTQPCTSLSQILQPHKSQMEGAKGTAVTHSHSWDSSPCSPPFTSSAGSSMSSSTYPLALAVPNRYLHEKSPNTTTGSGQCDISFLNASIPTPLSIIPSSQRVLQSVSGGVDFSASSSNNTGRLQHVCRFCRKVFSSDSGLQIHIRSHTGERPYQCPVCLSRFTTRGNLKVHFLRHREQNPELSLSLLPPSLFGVALGATGVSDIGQIINSETSTSGMNITQKKPKTRAEDERCKDNLEVSGTNSGLSVGTSEESTPSSLPLPPSVDLSLISHSLLQLNRAVAAAASIASCSAQSSSSSSTSTSSLATSLLASPSLSSSSTFAGLFKGAKQQHFDENTPPHAPLLPPAAYSQLAHLPKLLFPTTSTSSSSQAANSPLYSHPALGLLRTQLPSVVGSQQHTSSHSQFSFPVSSFPKVLGQPTTTLPSFLSSSVSTATPTSETSKLQRLVEKLEKAPPLSSSPWTSSTATTSMLEILSGSPKSSSTSSANSHFTNANTSTTYVVASPTSNVVSTSVSQFTREMVVALGMSSSGAKAMVGGVTPSLSTTGSPHNLATNQCGVCLRVLSCPRALRLHQATHLGERPFPCKICGRSFSTKGSLSSHLATHHARPSNTRVQNSCPLCQRKFTNALVLQHHIRMHLGGQLPSDSTEDSKQEISLEYNPKSSIQSKSTDQHPTLSITPPLAGHSKDQFPGLQCQALTVGSIPASVSIKSTKKSHSKSPSPSPDKIPPTDLSPEPFLNPISQTPPPGLADPPILSISAPLPLSQQSDRALLASEDSQVQQQPSAEIPVPTSDPAPLLSSGNKTTESSPALLGDHGESKESSTLNTFLDATSDLDNLQSTAAISAHFAYTAPGITSDSIPGQEVFDVHAQTDSTSPKPQSPEPMEEGKGLPPLSPTPKQDQVTVPDKDPKQTSMVVHADDLASNVSAESQRAVTSARETRQSSHFGSYGREDCGLVSNEALDVSVPISLAPTLPSPMSRPEKKTYCCAECGKEYASRSGLKVRNSSYSMHQ